MSPAAPWAPRSGRPCEISPAPIPVPTLTNIRCSTSGHARVRSPSAIRFASLSTSAGAPNRRVSRSATGYPSQPGMIGGAIGIPAGCSTGPGRPTPTARSGPVPCGTAASASSRPSSQSITRSGPSAIAMSCASSASTVPARSVTPSRACAAPRSAASTMPAARLKLSTCAGRPPVAATSASDTSSRRESSASTRCAIVERASPVVVTRSLRVVASPRRMRRRTAPAPLMPALLVSVPAAIAERA